MNLSEKIVEKLAQQMAKQISRVSPLIERASSTVGPLVGPVVESVIEEVKSAAQHPRSVGTWIESKSPWLNRKFLSAASNLIEPFLVGMGLKVDRLAEEVVEVSMPGIWRNQGESGDIHTGALVSLGEFAMRLFWEYHLDLRRNEMATKRVQIRILVRPRGEMKAVFRMPMGEREEIFQKLRASGVTEIETQTMIYDSKGRLVAEVEAEWELRRQLALGSSSTTQD